ncbi:inhibitor of KinA [Gelidibacter sediminis]|uniref:Inhibitor of KinA n=1 Tax=Gelidibacter sediminis TaxID=1608710 RepID=A0A4R7Q0A0_9FLAO|nr:5-oxoprolinase subunit PxpB [Gelidibacter sediminis]TDU39871.1 inhibitor of KinA [Gelidibacter sediminis]
MSSYKLTYTRFSERSILIQWPEEIDPKIHKDLLRYKENILKYSKDIIQVINTYNALLLAYTTIEVDYKNEIERLKLLRTKTLAIEPLQTKLWKIPVCYDVKYGLDLEELAAAKNSSIAQLVQWHTEAVYKVYFIGFLPGFLYLGGLDNRLIMPRRQRPRPQIMKGAVGIGGNQTGVYPNASPGGWNIIGNSPITFFDAKAKQPCFANAGDNIQFVAIDINRHAEIRDQIDHGNYKLESEVGNG